MIDPPAGQGNENKRNRWMKILLVDDAKSVVLVMTSRLIKYGYEVVHAGDGQEAVTQIRRGCAGPGADGYRDAGAQWL